MKEPKMNSKTKYIFVTGGVVSSLGKGITVASLGMLLKSRGLNVIIQKFDPYLNMDPGTMSPYQHGEVFVTEDGAETDLDLGHYERFIDQNVSRLCSVSSGMVFWDVLSKERRGDYLGHTVQIIPHVTNEIQNRITQVAVNNEFDVVLTEVGGTIGDIEGLPFLEAIRQFQYQNRDDCLHIHLTLVPFISTAGELKTKPTQHSVKELREIGIHPDVIICRATSKLDKDIKNKIALFCDVRPESVVSAHDADSIYDVPFILSQENLDGVVISKLGLKTKESQLTSLQKFIEVLHTPHRPKVSIAIVGKYTELSDAYLSVVESLTHSAVSNYCDVDIVWVQSDQLTEASLDDVFAGVAGILVPGGFGDRGIDGKVLAAKYAREHDIAYLGLCLGLHAAVIDVARHVLGWTQANSTEFNKKTDKPVIDLMQDQHQVKQKGGTMRLGAYPCHVTKGTKAYQAYGEVNISERHRHRYEFNNNYRSDFESAGLVLSGEYLDKNLVEIVEFKANRFHVACQFHPEFKSRPGRPHPLFNSFVKAAKELV